MSSARSKGGEGVTPDAMATIGPEPRRPWGPCLYEYSGHFAATIASSSLTPGHQVLVGNRRHLLARLLRAQRRRSALRRPPAGDDALASARLQRLGTAPFGYDLTDVLLHSAGTLLVGLVSFASAGRRWRRASPCSCSWSTRDTEASPGSWAAPISRRSSSAVALLSTSPPTPPRPRQAARPFRPSHEHGARCRRSVRRKSLRHLSVLSFTLAPPPRKWPSWRSLADPDHLIHYRDDWRRSRQVAVPYLGVIATTAVGALVVDVPIPG